ncbi:MAG: aspartate carbamoyltransferase [Deltaproteobacteria bacterium]|nr:aspartate carbamoyltransferase [Deltaproteobacteria bacterium]
MKRDLISLNDLSLETIQGYLELAARVESMPAEERRRLLAGRILAVLFYEPSTRTRLSFESAMFRLGGNVLGFSETGSTSVAKGESLADTIRTVEQYADIIVIRHPKEGTARLSAASCSIPVINAGDGTNQHPSQTLLDLYTIRKLFGRIQGLRIAFVGDLKYSRTVHSLLQALGKFGNATFRFVSPESLRMPSYLRDGLAGSGCTFTETVDLGSALAECDLVYMTRIQKERFPDILEYEKVKNAYCIDARLLRGVPERLRIMHPLPRVNEIAPDVDPTVHAAYFPQVGYGVTMRQAILLDLLGVKQ